MCGSLAPELKNGIRNVGKLQPNRTSWLSCSFRPSQARTQKITTLEGAKLLSGITMHLARTPFPGHIVSALYSSCSQNTTPRPHLGCPEPTLSHFVFCFALLCVGETPETYDTYRSSGTCETYETCGTCETYDTRGAYNTCGTWGTPVACGTRGTCKTCGTGGTRNTCGTCGTSGTCRTCDTRGTWGSFVVRGTLWDAWGPAEATRECDKHLRVAEAKCVGKCASLA